MSKLAGRYNRYLTALEIEKCEKDNNAFDGDNCVTSALYFCLKLKGEERIDNKKTSRIQFST